MSVMELPSHGECTDKVRIKDASALERFIYHNEPAGPSTDEWREQVAEMLEEFETKDSSKEIADLKAQLAEKDKRIEELEAVIDTIETLANGLLNQVDDVYEQAPGVLANIVNVIELDKEE